jgi:tRNA-dihydrouridine synthase B
MFSGSADWRRIAELKAALSIPVSGNGDIDTPDDAMRLWSETGCDGVMIGRAAVKNPWIFRQIAARRAGGPVVVPSLAERRDLILHHFTMLRAREEEMHALHKIRTFTGWYTHGLPDGRALRQRINSLVSVSQFIDAVEEFFGQHLAA